MAGFEGKKVPGKEMPSGGAYGADSKAPNMRDLLGAAPAPSVPGEQISPALADEISRQSPPLRAGIADIVRRKQAQS
jgi:hypothetical protein